MAALRWTDADEIGYELHQAHPRTDPLSVLFTDLHRMVVSLPGFADDPAGSSEGVLEAIQSAWVEYHRQDD